MFTADVGLALIGKVSKNREGFHNLFGLSKGPLHYFSCGLSKGPLRYFSCGLSKGPLSNLSCGLSKGPLRYLADCLKVL